MKQTNTEQGRIARKGYYCYKCNKVILISRGSKTKQERSHIKNCKGKEVLK